MRRRLSVLLCLLIVINEISYAHPTQGGTSVDNKGLTSRINPSTNHNGGKTEKEAESELTKSRSQREVTLDHGVAEEHGRDHTGRVNGVHNEEVNHGDSYEDDDGRDEILEENYQLPEGKPWKEERYTSDWLYSGQFPALTAEVHWHCPFYINVDAKEAENKRKRAEDKECVTTAQLKYWYQHQNSATDVLLDTFRVTYIPTYVLQETNVLKYIKPHTIVENKITVNVAFQYHSEISCKQFTYEIQEHGKAVKIKEEKHKCKKDDESTTSFFTTTEWGWETDDDDEDEDFNLEAEREAKDQNEEEEAHTFKPHEYDHGTHGNGGGVKKTAYSEHSDHKLSHREEVLDGREHGEHKHVGDRH